MENSIYPIKEENTEEEDLLHHPKVNKTHSEGNSKVKIFLLVDKNKSDEEKWELDADYEVLKDMYQNPNRKADLSSVKDEFLIDNSKELERKDRDQFRSQS